MKTKNEYLLIFDDKCMTKLETLFSYDNNNSKVSAFCVTNLIYILQQESRVSCFCFGSKSPSIRLNEKCHRVQSAESTTCCQPQCRAANPSENHSKMNQQHFRFRPQSQWHFHNPCMRHISNIVYQQDGEISLNIIWEKVLSFMGMSSWLEP